MPRHPGAQIPDYPKIPGTCFDKGSRKWKATFTHNSKTYYFGLYAEKFTAAIVCLKKLYEMHRDDPADKWLVKRIIDLEFRLELHYNIQDYAYIQNPMEPQNGPVLFKWDSGDQFPVNLPEPSETAEYLVDSTVSELGLKLSDIANRFS